MPSFSAKKALPLGLAGLLALSWPFAAQAGKLYRFQDADGNMLLTNQVSADRRPLNGDARQYRKLVKVTWYAAARPAATTWTSGWSRPSYTPSPASTPTRAPGREPRA